MGTSSLYHYCSAPHTFTTPRVPFFFFPLILISLVRITFVHRAWGGKPSFFPQLNHELKNSCIRGLPSPPSTVRITLVMSASARSIEKRMHGVCLAKVERLEERKKEQSCTNLAGLSDRSQSCMLSFGLVVLVVVTAATATALDISLPFLLLPCFL